MSAAAPPLRVLGSPTEQELAALITVLSTAPAAAVPAPVIVGSPASISARPARWRSTAAQSRPHPFPHHRSEQTER